MVVLVSISLLFCLWIVSHLIHCMDFMFRFKVEINKYIPLSKPVNKKMRIKFLNHPWLWSSKETVIQYNDIGLQGPSLQPKYDKLKRVFLFGDSFIADYHNTYSDRISSLLESSCNSTSNKFCYQIINCAAGGETSKDFISLLVHRVIHLNPDIIVLCCGINDFLYNKKRLKKDLLEDYLSLHNDGKRTEWSSFFMKSALFLSELQIARLLVKCWIWSKGMDLKAYEKGKEINFELDLRKRYTKKSRLPINPDLTIDMDFLPYYLRNLVTFLGVTKLHGIKTVLWANPCRWSTQLNNDEDFFATDSGLVRYPQNKLAQAYETIIQQLQNTAKQYQTHFLNLNDLLPKEKSYWLDDNHLSSKGNHFIAPHLADYLLQIIE